jgi:5'-nucleotidase
VLFSGDLFSPSMLSSYFKGEQMIAVFNRLNIKVSCLGNHDTDFGLEKMSENIAKTNSVWIMSNLFQKDGVA